MSTNVQATNVLKTPFMRELVNAFKHIDSVARAARENDYSFFMGCSISELTTGSVSFEEYFCRNILKKITNVDVEGVDPTENAKEKFLVFLDRQRSKTPYVRAALSRVDSGTAFGRVMLKAKEILHETLKDFQAYRVVPRFTAGATHDLSKVEGSNPFNRSRSSSGVNTLAKRRNSYFVNYGLHNMWPISTDIPVVKGCNLWEVAIECVPKTWDTDRIIGKQLVVPLAYQSGTGDWLTKRAARVGLDIRSAQEVHKNVARLSSLFDDHLMTLDQSNASDNIIIDLVKYLVPIELYDWLDAITPREIVLDGSRIPAVDMMATAGNGYIFPLQTLIFWALAKATCIECKVTPEIYSYGDDLIAPKAIASQLEFVFDLLGLQVNQDKTFREGHFRESCGGDFLLGSNVRPFYAKVIPTTTLEWIRCINGIRRVGFDNNGSYWRTNSFKRFWYWCIAHIPRAKRLFAPTHYGDGAIGTDRYSLYKLSYKRAYQSNGKRTRYPSGGLHKSGHPYSGWYIETYALKSTGGVSFGKTLASISSEITLRLISLTSVQGAGLRLKAYYFDDNNVRLAEPLYKLGYLPFFERNERQVCRVESPLFLTPPAPDSVEALFNHIGSNNQLFDTDEVVRRGQARYDDAISRLLNLLSRRATVMNTVVAEVNALDFNF